MDVVNNRDAKRTLTWRERLTKRKEQSRAEWGTVEREQAETDGRCG
jgi:hypothetical protein